MVWHAETALPDVDIVVLPGGFAHGDYLRTGAIARFSPIMEAVQKHADAGGLVIGICNGFQILCEAGLLPGALRKNSGLKFLCKWVDLRVENDGHPIHVASRDRARCCGSRSITSKATGTATRGGTHLSRPTVRSCLRYVDNPNGSLEVRRRDHEREPATSSG